MVHGIGGSDSNLTREEVKSIIEAGTALDLYRKKRVLVLTPDATRTCPLPMMIQAIRQVIGERSAIMGVKDTPVRRVINRAMDYRDIPIHCLSMVVSGQNSLCGLYAGDVNNAWAAAADLSARIHVIRQEKPYRIVLGKAPEMHDEIWVRWIRLKLIYRNIRAGRQTASFSWTTPERYGTV